MATRNVNATYFGDIVYDANNVDKRWSLTANEGAAPFASDAAKALVISDLFASSGGLTENAVGLRVPAAGQPIVIAVRIPQTLRLLDTIIKDLDANVESFNIYVSGRSDKKYSEIIDWVKVSDSSDLRLESDVTGFIPDETKLSSISGAFAGTPVKGSLQESGGNLEIYNGSSYDSLGSQPASADVTHSRFFPYLSSWVKIEFVPVVESTDSVISRVMLNDFTEDVQEDPDVVGTNEDAPVATMVYPRPGKDWLPSQTVYATARVVEPNSDAAHFGFEIYKESSGTISGSTWDGVSVFGQTGGDYLLHTIESNALNLDGTKNENYSHSWHPLGVALPNSKNSIPLSGSPGSPRAILVVPLEGANGGTVGKITNIKFYKNSGNVLLLDVLADAGTKLVQAQNFQTPITLPTSLEERTTAQGWVIEMNASDLILGFDRIDIIGDSNAGNVVTKVELYYMDSDIASIPSGLSNVEVDTDGLTKWKPGAFTSYQAPPFVANIEFCFPKTNNYITGYSEGTVAELIAEANNEFNPANNGNGFDQSNAGDWPKVPKFSGIVMGDASDPLIRGDSPIDTADTKVSNVALAQTDLHKMVYARLPLQDPYTDGERYYVRAYVWDGRTKTIV